MTFKAAGKTYVIAEAGVNHNGSLDLAIELVEIAKHSGADVVKFQTFKAKKLVSKSAPKAEYQIRQTGASESQFEMIKRLELTLDQHHILARHCEKLGIEFLSTPFDEDSADFLIRDLGLARLKVPSGEITNAPYLLHLSRLGKEMILSTGMATLGEIEEALGVLAFGFLNKSDDPSRAAFREAYASDEGRQAISNRVTLLHCTTEYPAPFAELNLRAIKTLRTAFRLPVGFSDHSPGIEAPIAAVALGATVIEKHFTKSRALPGPDHKASLEPSELKAMIDSIRNIEVAMGDGVKGPTPSEAKNISIARKSLVAAEAIEVGATFSPSNLAIKRPGNGISPLQYWDYLGKKSPRFFHADELIE